jgi:Ca-activated chloride channel family protein
MLYYLLDFSLAPGIEAATQPLNLMLVLDHSSSMARGDKMIRLKEAVARIIDLLGAEDYLGIISFGDRASVLLPSAPLGDKRSARAALDSFRSRGGTEISTGLRLGLHALQNLPGKQVAGLILLTDGQTYGDEAACLDLAMEAGERAVQITALGLGDDWNSHLLDAIAARSGGQACYVPTAETLISVFESQVRTLQLALMRNVCLSVRPIPACRVLRATWVAPTIASHSIPSYIGAGQAVELDLGRFSTNRTYRLLIEVVVSRPSAGKRVVANIVCSYDAPTLNIAQATSTCVLNANFVNEDKPEPPVQTRVLDALRKITAYRLQEQAVQAIEDGQTLKGTASLRTAAKHLEDAGHADLAVLVRAEASRAERAGATQPANVKRMLYGTRGLG